MRIKVGDHAIRFVFAGSAGVFVNMWEARGVEIAGHPKLEPGPLSWHNLDAQIRLLKSKKRCIPVAFKHL